MEKSKDSEILNKLKKYLNYRLKSTWEWYESEVREYGRETEWAKHLIAEHSVVRSILNCIEDKEFLDGLLNIWEDEK